MTLTIAELDAEIEETERRLFSLKSRRNSLTALCRTPPEIIWRIIKGIQGRMDDGLPLRADEVQPLDTQWRHLMLACKYLRDVAMENPDVWACIDGAWRKEWIELSLERAKGMLLVISADSRVKGRSNRTAVLRHLSQASVARLWPGSSRERERMEERLHRRPLHSLTTLSYGHAARDVEINLQPFLGGRVAQLEKLFLGHVHLLGGTSHVFSNLRQIQCDELAIHSHFDVESALNLLRHTPRLEALDLKIAGIRHLELQTAQPVDMPNLHTVNLHSGVPVLALSVLRALPIPKHTLHVSLMCSPGDVPFYWWPHLGGHQAEIFAVVTQFYKSVTGLEIGPPGFAIIVGVPGNIPTNVSNRSALVFRSEANTFSLSFITPCVITEHVSILDLVQSARITGPPCGKILRNANLQALRNLSHVDIEGATLEGMNEVEDWIREWQQERPNASLTVDFTNCCDEGAREAALRLRDLLSPDHVNIYA
jgi:hypothetical protein